MPPPPSVPQIQKLLGDAIKKLYKQKIPAPPKMAVALPPIPEEADPVGMATLTKEKAPPAPTNVPLPPPLDKAIIKRNSILVPPPPTVPELRQLLFSKIKDLYKSKIPKPPQNLPIPPPLPESAL